MNSVAGIQGAAPSFFATIHHTIATRPNAPPAVSRTRNVAPRQPTSASRNVSDDTPSVPFGPFENQLDMSAPVGASALRSRAIVGAVPRPVDSEVAARRKKEPPRRSGGSRGVF